MSVTRIELSIPRPQLTMLASNLLGVLGLVAVVVAAGGLTGNWWWSALVGGIIAVALAWVAATHAQQDAEAEPAGGEGEAPPLRAVPVAREAQPRSAAAA